MEKDKKYNIVLGLMIFFFILFVGVCVAWGLSYMADNKTTSNNIKETEKNDIIVQEETSNTTNNSNIKYPLDISLEDDEIADIIEMLETKIKFVTPSDYYTDNFNTTQLVSAGIFFYANDNPQREYTGYIETSKLTPVIKKYFGVENINYREVKGYFEDKQAFEEPAGWGSTYTKFITKAQYIDIGTLQVHIDEVNVARFDNWEAITKDTYTEDMLEAKLIATIKLNTDGSFILANYGYSEKDLYNK